MSWSNNLKRKKKWKDSSLKNDFENQNFEIFEEIVHYVGKSDHDPDDSLVFEDFKFKTSEG